MRAADPIKSRRQSEASCTPGRHGARIGRTAAVRDACAPGACWPLAPAEDQGSGAPRRRCSPCAASRGRMRSGHKQRLRAAARRTPCARSPPASRRPTAIPASRGPVRIGAETRHDPEARSVTRANPRPPSRRTCPTTVVSKGRHSGRPGAGVMSPDPRDRTPLHRTHHRSMPLASGMENVYQSCENISRTFGMPR